MAAGLLLVVVRSASAATLPAIIPAGISPEIAALAAKWANARGLPVQWVLTTIKVESGGNPNTVGDYSVDPKGASIGLMQINTVEGANGPLLRSLGVTRAMLFNPDINIMVGTLLMKNAYDNVIKALGGRTPPADLGLLTRLAYWGPARTISTLAQGGNPAVGNPQATTLIVNPWNKAIAQTSAYA